jgi:hypothetical protein
MAVWSIAALLIDTWSAWVLVTSPMSFIVRNGFGEHEMCTYIYIAQNKQKDLLLVVQSQATSLMYTSDTAYDLFYNYEVMQTCA